MMGHIARNNIVKKSDPGMWAPLRRSKAVHTLGEFRFTSEMRRINAAASPKIIGPQTFAKRPYADALTPTVNEYNRLCLLKNLGSQHAFCPFCLLVNRFLVSPDQVHAVAIWGVGLQLRNRTSRFRFCAVAAR